MKSKKTKNTESEIKKFNRNELKEDKVKDISLKDLHLLTEEEVNEVINETNKKTLKELDEMFEETLKNCKNDHKSKREN